MKSKRLMSMLHAASLRVEYVSPNIEKLVGIPTQKILQNIYEIETLFKSDESVHILEELETIKPGEQREWEREYIHKKTREEPAHAGRFRRIEG